MTPVRLEPAALRSRVKHSTTESLRSLMFSDIWSGQESVTDGLIGKRIRQIKTLTTSRCGIKIKIGLETQTCQYIELFYKKYATICTNVDVYLDVN